MFSNQNKFMDRVYNYQIVRNQTVVKESQLLSVLSINYKELHEIADFWRKKGYVQVFMQRGGTSEVMLTEAGIVYYETKIRKQHRVFFYCLGLLLLVGIVWWLGFRT
jgi:hypothetical protein